MECSALTTACNSIFAMSARVGILWVAYVRCFSNVNFLTKHRKSFKFREFGPRGTLDIKVDVIYDNILDSVLVQTNVCERFFLL